jgi:hypothetical protein
MLSYFLILHLAHNYLGPPVRKEILGIGATRVFFELAMSKPTNKQTEVPTGEADA